MGEVHVQRRHSVARWQIVDTGRQETLQAGWVGAAGCGNEQMGMRSMLGQRHCMSSAVSEIVAKIVSDEAYKEHKDLMLAEKDLQGMAK